MLGHTCKELKKHIIKKRLIRSDDSNMALVSIPVAALSKLWVYGRSLAGIAGSNPAGKNGYILRVLSVVR
jgi:hypothetical protein